MQNDINTPIVPIEIPIGQGDSFSGVHRYSINEGSVSKKR